MAIVRYLNSSVATVTVTANNKTDKGYSDQHKEKGSDHVVSLAGAIFRPSGSVYGHTSGLEHPPHRSMGLAHTTGNSNGSGSSSSGGIGNGGSGSGSGGAGSGSSRVVGGSGSEHPSDRMKQSTDQSDHHSGALAVAVPAYDPQRYQQHSPSQHASQHISSQQISSQHIIPTQQVSSSSSGSMLGITGALQDSWARSSRGSRYSDDDNGEEEDGREDGRDGRGGGSGGGSSGGGGGGDEEENSGKHVSTQGGILTRGKRDVKRRKGTSVI